MPDSVREPRGTSMNKSRLSLTNDVNPLGSGMHGCYSHASRCKVATWLNGLSEVMALISRTKSPSASNAGSRGLRMGNGN